MKNSDQPIHPHSEDDKDRLEKYPDAMYVGLTKREYFAAMVANGFISKSNVIGSYHEHAKIIIEMTDVILSELENNKP